MSQVGDPMANAQRERGEHEVSGPDALHLEPISNVRSTLVRATDDAETRDGHLDVAESQG